MYIPMTRTGAVKIQNPYGDFGNPPKYLRIPPTAPREKIIIKKNIDGVVVDAEETVITLFCQSVSWDAVQDRGGDGAAENPFRNILFALEKIRCLLSYTCWETFRLCVSGVVDYAIGMDNFAFDGQNRVIIDGGGAEWAPVFFHGATAAIERINRTTFWNCKISMVQKKMYGIRECSAVFVGGDFDFSNAGQMTGLVGCQGLESIASTWQIISTSGSAEYSNGSRNADFFDSIIAVTAKNDAYGGNRDQNCLWKNSTVKTNSETGAAYGHYECKLGIYQDSRAEAIGLSFAYGWIGCWGPSVCRDCAAVAELSDVSDSSATVACGFYRNDALFYQCTTSPKMCGNQNWYCTSTICDI